jgi:hypothetical protein
MSSFGNTIEPGVGLGTLRFGLKRNEITAILGEPDDVDVFTDEEDYTTESWHYDEIELSLSFDEAEDWRMTAIAVSDPKFMLAGQQIIGMQRDELIEKLTAMNLGELSFEDWSSAELPDHKLISIDALSLNLWMEFDELTEIQWGPLFNDEDEIIWP